MKLCSIEALERLGAVRAFYTTKEDWAWKYEQPEAADNYRQLALTLGIPGERMVKTRQTHTADVRTVSGLNGGEGVLFPAPEKPWDGLVTNEPGLLLISVEADCVPVYLYDPENRAVGMLHSGWRGTASEISAKGLEEMKKSFGTDPAKTYAAFGPCISAARYEVGEELIKAFAPAFAADTERLFSPLGGGKYLLDMKAAIRITLRRAGMPEAQIFDSGKCTCTEEELCSYRRTRSTEERMLTGIMLDTEN